MQINSNTKHYERKHIAGSRGAQELRGGACARHPAAAMRHDRDLGRRQDSRRDDGCMGGTVRLQTDRNQHGRAQDH